MTQFGQMCQRLGIRIIAANSPQAKGRVERNHGTHQDRFVKKMRLKKIQTHAEANGFLEKEYLPEHNRRFRRTPAQPENYHRATPRAAELEEVFHLETGRVIGNDWVVRHDNRYFQVKAQARQYAPAKGKVTVCEWEDGRLQIRYRGTGGGLGGDSRPGSSSSSKTQGGHGQETEAAYSQSGSPLAAGLSQDAPLEQARDTANVVDP